MSHQVKVERRQEGVAGVFLPKEAFQGVVINRRAQETAQLQKALDFYFRPAWLRFQNKVRRWFR
jgi:hypothetical protein